MVLILFDSHSNQSIRNALPFPAFNLRFLRFFGPDREGSGGRRNKKSRRFRVGSNGFIVLSPSIPKPGKSLFHRISG
jgi:hypothetical protein